jgi:Tfp pilus assembly protein PilO
VTLSPYLRSRIALGIFLAAAFLSGMWFWKTYRPRAAELAERESALAEMRTANRDARAREMAMGADSVEALRRRSRGEADQLAMRVPPQGGNAGSTQPFVDALSEAARRLGVRVHNYQPLQPATEGQFQVDGLKVLVAGRYHDVGTLMAELLSQPRLTQIRGARLAVVPDSLMNASVEAPRPGAGPAFATAPADSVLTIPSGEAPFNVVAAFSLHWFSVAGAASPAADSVAPAPAAPDLVQQVGEEVSVPLSGTTR